MCDLRRTTAITSDTGREFLSVLFVRISGSTQLVGTRTLEYFVLPVPKARSFFMRRRVALVLLFVFTSIFPFAQDKTPKQVQDTQTLEREHQEHGDRQAGFRNGRTSPNASVPAADMLHRAQQQRQALRVLRQQQTAARSTARAG